jgi:HK97 family phage major capsid protein
MQYQGVEIDLSLDQLNNMSGPILRAEIAKHWTASEEIASRHGGVVLPEHGTDYAQEKKLLATLDCLEERSAIVDEAETIARRRQQMVKATRVPAETHRQPDPDHRDGGNGGRRMTLGARFTSSDQYLDSVKRRAWDDPQPRVALSVSTPDDVSMIRELKALVTGLSDTSAGALILADRQPALMSLYPELSFLDLLPTVPTTSDLVEWVVPTFTNAAAPVLEATAATGTSGTKAESGLALAVQSAAVQSIAHWIPVTTRAIADAPQLRAIIDGELLAGLNRVLEAQCLIGTGTAPQLQGLMTIAGTQTTAAGANIADSFFTAQMLVRTNGFVSPNANVMDAAAWSAIRLARENAATGTAGGYLLGSPGLTGAQTLWGLPVVLCEALPANQGVVGDFTPQSITLFTRESGSVGTGWINDQYIRNIVTILAELRATLAIKRVLSFCKVTGLP